MYTNQFFCFLNIVQHNKYINLYIKDGKTNLFNPLLFLFFSINFSVFIHIVLQKLNYQIGFYNVFIIVNIYFLSVYLIKTLVFKVLNLIVIGAVIFLQNTTINHFIGFILFVFNLIFIFIFPETELWFVYFSAICIGFLFILSFVIVLTNNLKLVLRYWFYFILYLCTFKISPILVGIFLTTR